MTSQLNTMIGIFIVVVLGFVNGDKDNFKVFNGNDAKPNEFPYMVALYYQTNSGDMSFFCGGALVNESYVLTAGHCAFDATIQAYLGVHNKSEDESSRQRIDVESFIVHPNYDENTIEYDYALFKLASPATIVSGVVETIPVNRNKRLHNKIIRKSRRAILTGWGLKKYYDGWFTSEILQKLNVNFIADDECVERGNYVISTTACYEAADDVCSGSCSGDSGSPVVYKLRGSYLLMAVHSYRMNGYDGCATGVKGSQKAYLIDDFLNNYF